MNSAEYPLTPLHLLVVQPTPFCNINCTYCYLGGRSETRRMAMDTVHHLAEFLNGAAMLSEKLTVVWHAGEPLVAGQDFYDQAFGILAAECRSARLKHNFQTNGTLITEEWCDFFKK